MDEPLLPHGQPPPPPPPSEMSVDAGSQALSEALRSSFAIVKFVMVLLVVVFLASGFFTVGPQQQAIILRLGRPLGQGDKALLGPGPHWSLPYPIDESVIVSVSGLQQVRSTIGWYATTPAEEAMATEPKLPFGVPLNPITDGYLLTADTNVVHVRATLTYRISDPLLYIFSFVNASNTVQRALDTSLLAAAARYNVDDILTRDVIGFKETLRRLATGFVETQKLGVTIEDCVVERSRAPRQLQDDFDAVVNAEVKRTKLLTDARGYENEVISRAAADASSRTNVAEADRARLVKEIAGRAAQFEQLLPRYNDNPTLFVQQRLSETIGRVLTNVQDKIFLTESADGNSKELRLMLNRELPKPKAETKP